MSMYLPNPDLHPTGFEPAEYLDEPLAAAVPAGSRPPFEPMPVPVPVPAPTAPSRDEPVPTPRADGQTVDPRRRWLARAVTRVRRAPNPTTTGVYYLGRPAAQWRRALAARSRDTAESAG